MVPRWDRDRLCRQSRTRDPEHIHSQRPHPKTETVLSARSHQHGARTGVVARRNENCVYVASETTTRDGEIYTLNRDGTGLQELVNHPEEGVVAPVWNPSGKALIYTQRVGKWESHVFKIMLAGGPWERLTEVGLWK